MLIAIWVFNNITAHRLLITYYRMSSDSYCYQITNDFEKLLDLKSKKNTLMITALIFLIFYIHIRLTRFLKDSAFNIELVDVNKKLCIRSTGLN